MKTNSISKNCARFIYTGLRISYTRTIPASQLWLGHGLTPLPPHTLQVSFGWALGSINLWIVLVPLPPQNRQVITLFPPQLPQVQWPNLNNDILYLNYFSRIFKLYETENWSNLLQRGVFVKMCNGNSWKVVIQLKQSKRGGQCQELSKAANKWRPWRDSNSRPTA